MKPPPPLKVLSVASEIFPLIKTGGLADVTGALPAALAAESVAVHSLVPGYPAVMRALREAEPVADWPGYFGGAARILAGHASGLALFVLDAPHLFAREGNPYTGADGRDWPDNPQRFAALAYAASQLGRGAVPGFVPDVVHAHDWQAGLAPAYLHYAGGARPATIMTIHNLAFQGQVPATLLAELRLPPHAYAIDGVEYYGSIGMLKAGLALSDWITTVSPTYAEEICTPAGGMGMAGLLRSRARQLRGILNGIDTTVWDPSADPYLASPFSAAMLDKRPINKMALQTRLGLAPHPRALLFGVVSRLSHQKGMDFLLAGLRGLLNLGGQLAVLGAGDADLQQALAEAQGDHPSRVAVTSGLDEELAHLMQAGCDAILVPSRFEPCGLTQLCALRYGALPIVSRVGGLADTVIDSNEAARAAGVATGFVFAPANAAGLRSGIHRATAVWRDHRDWLRMQRAAMAADFGWSGPARKYAALYRECVKVRQS
jgi:starch synthase